MDVSIKTWQTLFPELRTNDLICACGKPSHGWKPFLDHDLAGLEAASCDCGRGGITVLQPRNAEASARWMQIINLLLSKTGSIGQ